MNKGYKNFILFLAILWAITVVIDIIYMILLYRPYFWDLAKVPFPVFVIIPLPVLLFYLPGYFTALWFGFLILTFSVFFLIAIITGLIKFENSAIFRISEFYALNLFLSVVYFLIVNAIGKPVKVPISSSTPFYLNMLSLTNAGLYEELITRVLYIGIPLFVYYRMKSSQFDGKKEIKWYRMIWGGGYKFGKPEITVLIISSIIFGIAHTASWDWSKMPQAFMGGLFLGILYLRYGLYADVLWHFSIDATSAFLPEGLGNPYANSISNGIAILIDLVFIFAGIVVLIYYAINIGKLRRDRGQQSQKNIGITACPKCGSQDISLIYDDIYRCNKCGNVFKKIR